ncbi:MAG: 50S ribosomal protein L11 methyltransferase [Pseudomonadota bacterium]
MNFLELQCQIIPFSEEMADILTAALNELSFESFLLEEDVLKAYLKAEEFDLAKLENHPDLVRLQEQVELRFSIQKLEPHNWNKEWEDHFEPIVVGEQIYVRGSFHPKNKKYKYEIIIDPKMSFGTGHSPPTALMLKAMLEIDFKAKRVLDMGCGTSILGILASKLKAKEVVGIDIDEWAINNSQENIGLNNIQNLKVILGDASLLKELGKFDIILANINLNILLNDLPAYQKSLNSPGNIILSGFYENDLEEINAKAKQLGFSNLACQMEENWVAATYLI